MRAGKRQIHLERYEHTRIADIPSEDRLASAEVKAWFDAASRLIEEAFEAGSKEMGKWKDTHKELDEIGHKEILERHWNEATSAIRRLHKSMGLLTEFEAYCAARQGMGSGHAPITRDDEQQTKVGRARIWLMNRPVLAPLIVFGLIVIAVASFTDALGKLANQARNLLRASAPSPSPSSTPLALYLKGIVQGDPQGKCAASATGGGVELFERGWLLVQFAADRDNFYAIVKNPNGGLSWFRRKSERLDGMKTECKGVPNEKLLRWGFRWWYCSDPKIRKLLGRPITKEIAYWPQYQNWTEGLLIAGVPTDPEGFSTWKFNALANMFLVGAQKSDQGAGQFNTINAYNISWKVYCNAVWYASLTGPQPGQKQTNPQLQNQQQGCPVIHTEEDFIKPRDTCSLCLE